MKYRKKPVQIEAFRFMIDTYTPEWFTALVANGTITTHAHGGCEIETLEGVMKASKGDYIIRGIAGEVYPCKPDIFNLTYEPVGLVCKVCGKYDDTVSDRKCGYALEVDDADFWETICDACEQKHLDDI